MTKYIFITGGVVSSLGKGITSASIGALLKIMGYQKLRMVKIDPYLNVDPGTMDPLQHGEVYTSKDGAEIDLDAGHYERFTEIETTQDSNITSGRLYQNLLAKERKGKYLGQTIQIVPHLTDDIKSFIAKNEEDYDFVLCEVGGTVGDIEATPIIEAIRQFKHERPDTDTVSVHVTLVPMLPMAHELKTKPTQHSVKQLMKYGIQPDFVVCRTSHELDADLKDKIGLFSNLKSDRIIEAIDMDSIYKIPLYYANQNLITNILKLCQLPQLELENMTQILERRQRWLTLCQNIDLTKTSPKKTIKLGIVGKYTSCIDAYKSLVESINHASWSLLTKVDIEWIDAKSLSPNEIIVQLKNMDCVIVPGGFGKEGISNKLVAINYCRVNKIPILGICLGMQLMVIEYLQNEIKLDNVVSSEWLTKEDKADTSIKYNIGVGFIEEWMTEKGCVEKRTTEGNLGGTMRLGNYTTQLDKSSKVYQLYDESEYITERHRHRYEVNRNLIDILNQHNLVVSGVSSDNLPEIVELKNHPYFVGCQFHPEFKSTPFNPRPLFLGLLKN